MRHKIDKVNAKRNESVRKAKDRLVEDHCKATVTERRLARKIRWLVISKWESAGDGADDLDSEADSLPGSETHEVLRE